MWFGRVLIERLAKRKVNDSSRVTNPSCGADLGRRHWLRVMVGTLMGSVAVGRAATSAAQVTSTTSSTTSTTVPPTTPVTIETEQTVTGRKTFAALTGIGEIVIERDGTGGISSNMTKGFTVEDKPMRLRISSDTPANPHGQHLLIQPYPYGMGFEYDGVVEFWSTDFSVHGSASSGAGAQFWVGDESDTGGVYATSRDALNFSEVASQKFGGALSHGALRLRVVSDADYVEVWQGAQYAGASESGNLLLRFGTPLGSPGIYFGDDNTTLIRRVNPNQLATPGTWRADQFQTTGTALGGVRASFGTEGAKVIGLVIKGTAAQTADLQQWWDSANAVLVRIDAAGTLTFGPTGDTNLYRSGADVLKTDDDLHSARDVRARDTESNQVIMGGSGPADAAGIRFGSAGDTNLYRAAADTLATDDDFEFITIGKGPIITSSDGTRYRVTIDDDGAIVVMAV
jgi:hypothetical protein